MITGAAGFVERRLLSRRRLATALLIVVIAIAAGAVMATAAGARRSASSLDRLVAWSRPVDAVTGGMSIEDGPQASAQADQILTAAAQLPSVTSSMRNMVIGDGVRLADGRTYVITVRTVAIDLTNPVFGRVKTLHGRMPDPTNPHEAVVGFITADLLGLHVGDSVEVLFGVPGEEGATTDPVTIVGIGAYPTDFPSLTGRADKTIFLTPAFQQAHPDRIDWTNGSLFLHLRGNGAAAAAQFNDEIAAAGLPMDDIAFIRDQLTGSTRVVNVEARALWLVAAVIGAATLLILFQLMRRDASLVVNQLRELRDLGMTRRDLWATGALRGARIGAIGAGAGVTIAVLASPMFPIGISRTADPDIGFHADLRVLAIGAAATILAAVITSVAGVHLAARRPTFVQRKSTWLSTTISHLGPVGATGARLAFAGPRGENSRSRLGLGITVATLALLLGSVSLETSFDHLLSTPRLVGATWDVAMNFDNPADRPAAMESLQHDSNVAAFGLGGWTGTAVNGQPVYTMIFDAAHGIDVAVDRGRAPRGATEIALGSADLESLGLSIGDEVTIAGQPNGDGPSPQPITVTVVGRSIVASPVYFTLPLGQGAAIPLELFQRLAGDQADRVNILVKLRSGLPLEAGYNEVVDRVHPNFSFARPENIGISSLDRLKAAIQVLLAILGVLCAVSFLHALLVRTRRNRRDMATLRTLGMTGRQATWSHILHGAVSAMVIVILAIPIAVVAASLTWRRVAEYMGAVARPITSVAVTATIAAVVLVIAGATARVVGWRESRRTPGELLRTE